MHDVLFLVARPGNILLAGREGHADRVHAWYDALVVFIDFCVDGQTNARHNAHVDHHVRRIGELHPDLRHGRTNRAHAERKYVHGSSFHRAVEELFQFPTHLKWLFPIIRGTSRVFRERANESAVFDTRDVARVRTRVITTGPEFLVELDEGAARDHFSLQGFVFCLRAINPLN